MRTRNSGEKRKWRGEIKTLKGELKQREEVNPVQYTLRWYMHVQCSLYTFTYTYILVLYMCMYSVRADGTLYM